MGIMPMNKLIATMSFPAMLSMLIQALYNIVDSIFVSRISENALAAVTLVFPIQMLMISVGVGTGVGLSSLIARRLGQKRFGDANDSAMHGFMIAIINWIVFALFGLLGIGPFIRLFSDDPELIWLAVRFGTIVTVGSPFVFMQINIEKTLQATGNMLFPMIFNIVGAVTNIILNPILIFGMFGAPALGIAGSATATVISQFLAMSLALFMFFGFKHAVKPNFREFRPKRRIFSDIYSVGLPSIVMQAIMSFTISGMNAILMQFTSTAVAVLGVYFRIQSLIFMPVFGLNQGVLPIIGYNFGARNKARLLECYKKACFVAVTIMLIGMTAFQLFPLQILHIFNASPDMLHIGSRALKIISICFVPAGFAIVSTTLFQALGHGVLSMLLSLMRQLLLILPFCYLLARFWGVDYVWFCYPMAEIFTVALLCFYVRRVYRKEIKNL